MPSQKNYTSFPLLFLRPGKGALDHLPPVLTYKLSRDLLETQLTAILGVAGSGPAAAAELPSSRVRGAWSSYLELVIEPAGWMAVWIPSAEVR